MLDTISRFSFSSFQSGADGLGDAMVFSDSFVADEDFSSMSDSEATLEKEPQDMGSPSEYDVIKQVGLNAGLSGAAAFAAPALMKYSSRLLSSSPEVEDVATDSVILVNSFNNSASFSQVGNSSSAVQGASAIQTEVA